MVDAETIDLWLKVATFLMAAGSILYTFIATRRKDVDKRFHAIEDRLTEVEHGVKDSPAQKDIHDIALKIAEISGEFKSVTAELRGQRDLMSRLDDVVTRHEEHLLRGGR